MAVIGNIQNMSPVGPSASSSSRRREHSAASSCSLSLAAMFGVAQRSGGSSDARKRRSRTARARRNGGVGARASGSAAADSSTEGESSCRASGTNVMRKTRLPSSAVLDPGAAVVLATRRAPLHAHWRTCGPGLAGSKATLQTEVRGQAGVARLPRLAAIFGDRDADAPAGHRDAVGRGRVERDVVRCSGPTPRLPLLSKVTPQSVDTNSPPPWVAASQ